MASKRLALDTNVLLDRANGETFAVNFFEIFRRRNYSLEVPPTVIIELDHLHRAGTDGERELAEIALRSLVDWGATPIVLTDLEKQYKKNFITIVQQAKLLPAKEINDLHILAETAIAEIPALVTSDRALLDVDQTGLDLALQNAGLSSVSPVHPGRMLRALR